MNLEVAKSAFLVLGGVVILAIFLWETWRAGKLELPWHPLVLAVVLLPVVYFVSAILSTPPSLSLFGYSFEVGTFGFILFSTLLLVLFASLFSNTARALQVLTAFFASFALIVLFSAFKILSGGDSLVLGNFFGNMGNSVGRWTDLAVSVGLLASFSVLTLGMIPMKLYARVLVSIIFVISLLLLIVIHFSPAFFLTLVSSVFLFFYFWKLEKHFLSTSDGAHLSPRFFLKPIFLPIILGLVSVVFLVNPTISSDKKLGSVVSSMFNVENVDVRPSLSATLGVSKAVLLQSELLGSGPNTFGRDWLVFKSQDINATPYWGLTFPFGIGFVPTQIASTGMVGTLLWFIFFVLLVVLAVKTLNQIPESRAERFVIISSLLITFFLWVASFIYSPSTTLLILAFSFTGLFVGLSRETGIISYKLFNLKESGQSRFVSVIAFVVILLSVIYLGWLMFGKTASTVYFKKALDLSSSGRTSLLEIEGHLNRAIAFSPMDIYYVALSRATFAQAQEIARSTDESDLENTRELFEESLRKSVGSARSAVNANPSGYQNWVALGMIYGALVPAPFSVEGSYENALYAYSEASRRNPLNPEIPLLLARLELNNGDKEAARRAIRNAIALKEDYADAYILLAQLEVEAGNVSVAIASVERLAVLAPSNPGIHFELGLLKYSTGDYSGAVTAFNRALSSSPDYANAKYYLGLALVRQGQLEKARVEFEDLFKSNPDNNDVRSILESLRAGKSPFSNGES